MAETNDEGAMTAFSSAVLRVMLGQRIGSGESEEESRDYEMHCWRCDAEHGFKCVAGHHCPNCGEPLDPWLP